MIILVGIGGALGAAVRYGVGVWFSQRMKNQFPYPTLSINIAGSFLLGILTGLKVVHFIPEWGWLLFGIGFCGAFTTFSTFGYEAIQLFLSEKRKEAGLYMISSMILCTVSAYIGILIPM